MADWTSYGLFAGMRVSVPYVCREQSDTPNLFLLQKGDNAANLLFPQQKLICQVGRISQSVQRTKRIRKLALHYPRF
jgi:hypothetical protein